MENCLVRNKNNRQTIYRYIQSRDGWRMREMFHLHYNLHGWIIFYKGKYSCDNKIWGIKSIFMWIFMFIFLWIVACVFATKNFIFYYTHTHTHHVSDKWLPTCLGRKNLVGIWATQITRTIGWMEHTSPHSHCYQYHH